MFPGERPPEKLSSIIMNKVGCRKFFLYFFLVILIAVLFVLLVTRPLICLVAYGTEDDHRTSYRTYDKSSMNIIYVVTEGLSPSSSTFARLLLGKDYPLPLDDGFAGITKTLSRSSGIPDAAAGSTALACGLLGYNGGVGVILDSDNSSPLNIPDGVHDPEPCASIFEASISLNYTAGIVTTGSLTQGSAPSFFAHMTSSVYEEKIAAQLLERSGSIDLIFGGGRSKFNQRLDRRDLISEMKAAGYNYFDSFNEDDLKDAGLPLLGLFADDHLAYAIDRKNGGVEGQASLSEMVQVALDKLHAVDGRFFLLVDARNIAASAHNHDATAHYYEIMELQDAVETIRNFVTKKDFNTVVVVATDHNVGGLSVGSDDHSQDEEDADIPRSMWSPKELFKQTRSAEFIVNSIITSVDGVKFNITEEVVREAFALAGVEDLRAFEIDHVRNGFSNSDEAVALLYVGDVLSWRGQVSWSTLGNVNSDSFFYNFGYRPTDLLGVLSAVDVPRILAHDLGLWSRMNSLTSSLTKQSDDLPPYLPPKI